MLLRDASLYAHARQMKRARAVTRKLRTQLGRVMREIERKTAQPTEKLAKLLETAHQIHARQRYDKNKIYSVHEPEVECIAKGKTGKKYGFGNKVSVAVTSRGGWLVGAKSFTGKPYDGQTLAAQLEQVSNLIGDRVSETYGYMGYRGHNYEGEITVRVDKRPRGRTPRPLWRWMKRRAAVEPGIGHLKAEHRLERNRLKGMAGDAFHAILSAAAMHFQKLLGAFFCAACNADGSGFWFCNSDPVFERISRLAESAFFSGSTEWFMASSTRQDHACVDWRTLGDFRIPIHCQ
jgi:IS5 family transposase